MLFIYGLIDPRTLLIRYVGLATNIDRPYRHNVDCPFGGHQARKVNWIQELRSLKIDYTVCLLEVCSTREKLTIAEVWWIAYGRMSGWDLTNLTDGGDGLLNPSPETRAKMRQNSLGNTSHLGHTVSEDGRLRMSVAHLGVPLSDEHKKRIGDGNRRYLSPEVRRARKILRQRLRRQYKWTILMLIADLRIRVHVKRAEMGLEVLGSPFG